MVYFREKYPDHIMYVSFGPNEKINYIKDKPLM